MHLPVVCAAVALLGGMPRAPVELSFHPAPGTELAKQFRLASSGAIESIRWRDLELVGQLPATRLEVEAQLRVTDHYEQVAGGRPLELVRDFDELRTVWNWRERSEVPHELLYRSVRFTWDERDECYERDWDPLRRHSDVPEGVWEDLDFRTLLPESAVQVGQRWSVPLAALAPALLPGGAIHRDETLWAEWQLFDLEQSLVPRSRHWFRNDEVSCRLDGLVDLDGRELARIQIAWDWWGWLDPVGPAGVDGWWGRLELDGAVVELALEGCGELLWDIERGHFRSFELDAQFEAELHLNGGFGAIEVRAEGQASWSAAARPVTD